MCVCAYTFTRRNPKRIPGYCYSPILRGNSGAPARNGLRRPLVGTPPRQDKGPRRLATSRLKTDEGRINRDVGERARAACAQGDCGRGASEHDGIGTENADVVGDCAAGLGVEHYGIRRSGRRRDSRRPVAARGELVVPRRAGPEVNLDAARLQALAVLEELRVGAEQVVVEDKAGDVLLS